MCGRCQVTANSQGGNHWTGYATHQHSQLVRVCRLYKTQSWRHSLLIAP